MQPILKIDLSSSSVDTITIPMDWENDFLGGASLAARILYSELTPDLDPFSPAAPLLFLTGPLTGTAGPAVGRFTVSALSPATRLWGESNAGGFWGPELRSAGFAGVWITGRAEGPVVLTIRDNEVGIHPAKHLWGMDTYSTQSAVASEWGGGKPRIAAIGPAGEALIPFALILTDHGRVAGRTGMGAVMGAKNLKAILVEGRGQIPVHNPAAYAALRSEANRQLRADAVTKVLHELGSAAAADYFDYIGEMPKRYFQTDSFEGAANISGSSIAESILDGVSTCHGCVIACGRVVRLEDGARRKGPEYETLVGFGPNLWVSDPVFITRVGELCDRYGMDTISLSNTIGLALTLYEKGLITESDTGGLQLHWGDRSTIERLVHLTAKRQGFGATASRRRTGVGTPLCRAGRGCPGQWLGGGISRPPRRIRHGARLCYLAAGRLSQPIGLLPGRYWTGGARDRHREPCPAGRGRESSQRRPPSGLQDCVEFPGHVHLCQRPCGDGGCPDQLGMWAGLDCSGYDPGGRTRLESKTGDQQPPGLAKKP